jgi:hypothetical protein
MLRTSTALAAFGLLALVFAIGLHSGNSAVSGLLPGEPDGTPLVNAGNGQAITLEMVQRDIEWHRETARMLRGNN